MKSTKNFLTAVSTKLVNQFCSKNVCSPQNIAAMKSKLKQRQANCKKPVFANEEFTDVDASFAAGKNGAGVVKITGLFW